MEVKILLFGEDDVYKNVIHNQKFLIDIDKVNIRAVEISSKDSHGKKGIFKYFIWYISDNSVFPSSLCIMLSQMNRYFKYFDTNNKYMNFLVHDKELLKKYNIIWDKICNSF